MSYQALYRAWRPSTFSEICDQDAVVRTLKRQVETDRIAHAYLFCGTRGTGKTSAAKVLARAINCLHPVGGDPCGECEICRALQAENCMDVLEIDAASNNSVDEIRDLRDKIKYPPTLTRYKVYIIDEVHMLSIGAFNALLKTLEEPPHHAVFILATTEPQKLPATILSRCQRFDFHRISMEAIVARLKVVLAGIGRSATDEALNEIARAAEGAMRDALSLLDVCLSFTDGEVDASLARDVLGCTGRDFMFEFTDAILAYDAGQALLKIDEALRRGSDPRVLAQDAAAHLRIILLAALVGDALAGLVEITKEDAQRFCAQASRATQEQLTRAMELFMHVDGEMKWAIQPRTIVELAAVRACHPEQEAEPLLAERMDRMEKLLQNGVAPAAKPAEAKAAAKPEAKAADPAKPATKPAAIPAATPPQQYLDAIDAVGQQQPSIRTMLGKMRFAGVEGDVVTVEFGGDAIMVRSLIERKTDIIEAALSQAFGRDMHLRTAMAGATASAAPATAKAARKVIEQSYEVFGRDKIDLTD